MRAGQRERRETRAPAPPQTERTQRVRTSEAHGGPCLSMRGYIELGLGRPLLEWGDGERKQMASNSDRRSW